VSTLALGVVKIIGGVSLNLEFRFNWFHWNVDKRKTPLYQQRYSLFIFTKSILFPAFSQSSENEDWSQIDHPLKLGGVGEVSRTSSFRIGIQRVTLMTMVRPLHEA
jgi:hypothetical protein